MRAFVVKQGTLVQVTRKNHDWTNGHRATKILKKDVMFSTEDVMFSTENIRVDPIGIVGTTPAHKSTIGCAWSRAGWYGFRLNTACQKAGWDVLLVPASAVEVL